MSYSDKFEEALEKELKKKKKKNASANTNTSGSKAKSDYSSNFDRALEKEMGGDRHPVKYAPSVFSDDDDIAPVAGDGGKKNSWFKSGGFSDGVDGVGDFFGDLGETVLGTAADLGIGVVKGAGRMVEGLVDLGTYGVAKAADALGADEFAEKAKRSARYSATDEWTKDAQSVADRYSILGNKADMVSEGLGQVGAIILTGGVAGAAGLGGAGVAAVTTGVTGLSSMGTNMGEAFDSGATDKDAFLYGLSTGAIEAGTELLFGGLGKVVKALGISRGIGGLDDIFAKKLASKIAGSITNEGVQKALGNTIEYAVKSSGEGLEEVLSGLGSAVMKNLTYEDDESLQKLIADENLLEQFVVGAVTSSIAQGADFVKATKSGTDLVTGQTAADEKVVSKVVEDEIARREKAGETLSTKDKNEIYDAVVEQMEHGQIDIDTIEEVLGGDAYKAYKGTVESEDALKTELDELRKMKSSDMNDLQVERMNELKGMNLADTTKRDGLRKALDDTLSPMLQNSKLSESYRERERRGQKFEADLSKYNGKQRAAVERAVQSGVLNNTYRSHELVDVLSKIEAEKGIVFDYTNNAKLKDSGFAVDGKTVNGFANKNKGTVTLNVQSNKAWQFVVGHEITHVLETNPEAYNALRESLYAYAESKGELESRRAATTALYDGMDADIEAELTADLVGDYLFTDKDFVSNLTGNRTLFQKIYDEIKYLWNKATGKEKTEIEKVKDEFDRVWKEFKVKGTSEDVSESKEYSDSDVQYSIREEAPPKETGVAYKVFFVKDGKLYPPMVANPDGADTPMGVWLNADVGTAAPPSKTGRAQVKAGGKGTQGGGGSLAFRPGWHLGDLPRASQFDRVNPETGKKELFPENFVWAEVEYAKDVDYQEEAMSYGYTENGKFRHAYAGLPRLPENGYYRYRTNPKPDTVPWVITGAMKVNRLLSDAEVNEILEANGVPAVHRQGGDVGLEKFGFDDGGKVQYSVSDSFADDSFTDIEGKERKLISHNELGYRVANTRRYNSYFNTAKEAIDAENENIKSFYAKKLGVKKSYINRMLENDDQFLAKLSSGNDSSTQFSLSQTVEETKDLMALHNLQASELTKTLELGGLPMPSIAVIKDTMSHEQYGDVSLILPKETIDPALNKDNKVYGGDAWTPTYPRIEYKPNERVAKKIRDKYYGLANAIGYDEVRPMYSYVNELEDALNRAGGEATLLEKLYEDTGMMNVYLQDSGKGKVEDVVKETVTKISDAEAKMNKFIVDALGEDFVASFNTPGGENPLKYRSAFIEQHESDIRDAYMRYFVEVHGFTAEEVDDVLANTAKSDLMKVMRGAYMYTQNNGVTVRTETDYEATNQAIREAASDGYKEWIDGLFKGIEEKSGIRNNQEYYTRSGNPRSWDALHWENTLENVIKVMKGQDETGVGSFSPFNTLFGASHKRYGSIQDIKADSGRLGEIDQDEYDAMKDSFSQRFAAIAESIKDPGERNPFIATDTAAEQIIEAVRTKKTKTGILNHLKKLNSRATMQTVDDVLSLVSDIANMPTGYFEAKPQRAVGLEEVGVFVIPRNADVKLKQELLNRGYSIAEYDPDVEGDRQRVVNQFEQYKFSLSNVGEEPSPVGNYSTPFSELAYGDDIAPTPKTVRETPKTEGNTSVNSEVYAPVTEEEADALSRARFDAITDADAPPETPAPYYGEDRIEPSDPFEKRDMKAVGNQKVKAYMYENPEVKPFFQQEAEVMLGDLYRSQKGERVVDAQTLYDTNGEAGVWGVSRHTSPEISELLDEWGYTYAEIEKGLKAIIEDNGKENNACSKRIEFMLNDRLMKGYEDFDGGFDIPANQDYINLVAEKEITEYNEEAWKRLFGDIENHIPPVDEEIAPTPKTVAEAPMLGQIPILPDEKLAAGKYEAIKPGTEKIAQVLTEEPKVDKKKQSVISKAIANFVDKGAAVENLSLKTKNRALQDTYKAIGRSETKAQYFMENGADGVKSLDAIRAEVEETGKVQDFYNYLYHKHNIDRMSLESRERPNLERLEGKMEEFKLLNLKENQLKAIASEKVNPNTHPKRAELVKTVREYLASKEVKNKPVFGYSVTAEDSQDIAREYEAKFPDFKEYAQDVYNYMNHLRKMMVYNGIISPETAELWAEMYPYYVPIRRADHDGLSINVPLDTKRTGVNAPIKGATGGNSDILPLFSTMAMRTSQTFKAIDRNRFGVELKDTLGGVTESTATNLDEVIDSIDAHESLLQKGENGKNPTFTVFDGGERVTFDITEELYDALKPTSEGLMYTNKVLNTASNVHRDLLTQYNLPFAITNAIKDAQDVLINSQHPTKTYANFPVAVKELTTKGKWFTEYMENGGGDNTYFDKQTNTFTKEKSAVRKIVGFPLDKIGELNNFIERVPRLAEYIASRKNGASVDAAMLDAARVTTDFSAGGDVTKFLNRNGVTFLNASVQGFAQQARNVREAKMNGLKGWLGLATKYAIAGLPAVLLNNLLWDDDEEYEELSDYVKESYYVVAKYGDGKFVRIPKGRTLAVIQNGFEQISNSLTGDDEADFGRFFELFLSNLAPNNPLDNNIIAPIKQVMENKTWYGEDLVPTRLQDLPAEEQFDESTDAISKWLGENLNVSPYKINYLLNQYSGGIGDIFMPMLTPEAESGDNSLLGNMIAPLKDKFTTDSVMNNQNVSDFYDTSDELTANANSSYATEEDVLKSKYFNSVKAELSNLYKAKREIQNSNLSDRLKYQQVREIQKQINELAKSGLASYEDVNVDRNHATVSDRHYKLNDEGEWQKINEEQVQKQMPFAKVYGGYSSYLTYASDLNDIHADKDASGKSINGSRKEKVIDYINNLDADYYTKIILYKSEYPSDDTYNYEIVNHINNRSDMSYDERIALLTELGFRVTADGKIYAD